MGGCGSHNRTKTSLSTSKHPLVEYRAVLQSPSKEMDSLPIRFAYIKGSDEYPPSTPALTSVNKSMDLHFSPAWDDKQLSVSKLCLFELSPREDQIRECSIKLVAENFPIQNKREGSVKITHDGSSTSFEDSAKECSSVGHVETELNPANEQSQDLGFEVAGLPPEIGEQLRKFLSKGNPEVKAAAAKLIELVTKLPALDISQRRQLAHMLRRSLDQNISRNENIVDTTGEPDDDPNFYCSSNSSPVSMESGQVQSYGDFFKLSRSKTVGSKTGLSITDDVSDSSDNTASSEDDEKIENIKSSDIGLVEFSKRQVIRSRRKSMQMSEFLENMPPLAQCLAETNGANLKESSIKGCYDIIQDNMEDIDLGSISSKIDELDVNISTSSQKITELRRRSLDLLTGVGDSRAYDWNGKKLSFVSGEHEIIRWQDHKNKLVDERNEIVVELHSKLFDKMTTTPLIYSPTKSVFPDVRDTGLGIASNTEMPCNHVKSNSITASL